MSVWTLAAQPELVRISICPQLVSLCSPMSWLKKPCKIKAAALRLAELWLTMSKNSRFQCKMGVSELDGHGYLGSAPSLKVMPAPKLFKTNIKLWLT